MIKPESSTQGHSIITNLYLYSEQPLAKSGFQKYWKAPLASSEGIPEPPFQDDASATLLLSTFPSHHDHVSIHPATGPSSLTANKTRAYHTGPQNCELRTSGLQHTARGMHIHTLWSITCGIRQSKPTMIMMIIDKNFHLGNIYYIPDTLHEFDMQYLIASSSLPCEPGTIISPILQARTLKQRFEQLARLHR